MQTEQNKENKDAFASETIDTAREAAEEQSTQCQEAEGQDTRKQEAELTEDGAQGSEDNTGAQAAEDMAETESGEKEPAEDGAAAPESQAVLELKDKYARLYAEFDNYRKRTEREKAQMYDMGAKRVIEKILPVVDNFERALQSIPEESRSSALAEGVDRIYKQLFKLFDELEVKAIEAVGAKFDPNLHNAVMTESEGEAEEDTVTEDLLKGYTYKGEVVRHSMVKVKK